MMSCGVVNLAVCSLPAVDKRISAVFYRDVVGLQPLHNHGERPVFALGRGAFLVLVEGKPVAQFVGDPPFPALALTVKELEIAVDQLESHGVEIPNGIQSRGETSWVLIQDPAGNLIELVQGVVHH